MYYTRLIMWTTGSFFFLVLTCLQAVWIFSGLCFLTECPPDMNITIDSHLKHFSLLGSLHAALQHPQLYHWNSTSKQALIYILKSSCTGLIIVFMLFLLGVAFWDILTVNSITVGFLLSILTPLQGFPAVESFLFLTAKMLLLLLLLPGLF